MPDLVPLETLVVIHSVVLLLFLTINAFTDILLNKIYNVVIVPGIVAGLIFNSLWGMKALINSFAGLLIGFVLFYSMYAFSVISGGDVKFMAAIGAIGVPWLHEAQGTLPFILWACFYSVLAGGLIAVIVMATKRNLGRSLQHVARTLLTFLCPIFHTEPLDPTESTSVPFGFGIAIGTGWTWFLYALGSMD